MPPRSRALTNADEAGLTLVEMVIAIAIGAIVFTALAAYLNGGLRMLAIQKARTQGNEIATQGIEDLQRLEDEYVGFCSAPASPPAGLSDAVILPNCASSTVSNPCSPPAVAPSPPADLVPAQTYVCNRLNISYTVKRYIAWADVTTKTEKHLEVYVTWTDSGNAHEVVQRSKRTLIPPPAVTAPTLTPAAGSTIDSTGRLSGPIGITATTTGLTAADTVRVTFTRRDTSGSPLGAPRPGVVSLAPSADGTTWTASIEPAAFDFPRGTQVFVVTAIRSSGDKREGSSLALPYFFSCTGAGCPSTPLPPTVSAPTVSVGPAFTSSSVDADAAGALVSDSIRVQVVTSGMTASGFVTAFVPTLSGARALNLAPVVGTCSTATCTWRGTVSRASAGTRGFRFTNTGSQDLYAVGAHVVTDGATTRSMATSMTIQ